ncbi:MAG: hypothetical protein ACI9N9_000800, partial [Enterobacterales bacterium]
MTTYKKETQAASEIISKQGEHWNAINPEYVTR